MTEILIFAKSLVDLFASGRSEAKIFLLAIFAAHTAILYFFRKRKPASGRRFAHASLIILGLVYAFGIFAHLHSLGVIGADIGKPILYLSQTEISSSELVHTHELKSSFGYFFRSFHDGIDMGAASASFLPAYVPWTGVFLLLLILVTYSLSILGNEFPSRKSLILSALLFFILLKNAYDGGLLNYEVAAVALFCLTLYCARRKWLAFLLLPLGALSFLSLFFFYCSRLVQTYAFVLALWVLIFRTGKKARISAAAVILALVCLNAAPNLQYLRVRPIEADFAYVATFEEDQSAPLVYSVGNLFVYQAQYEPVKALLKEYALVDNHHPVSVEWKTCIPHAYDAHAFTVSASGKPDALDLEKGGKYRLMLEKKTDGDYSGRLELYQCTSQVFENQLQEGLRELGLLPAIVSDISSD